MKIKRPPLTPTFDVPDQGELLDLDPGDLVKLIFTDDNGGNGERMWVALTDVSDSGQWAGTLANQPLDMDGLEHGAEITFHPYDAIDYIKEK